MFAQSSDRTRGGRALSTPYGSSRLTRSEARKLHRHAAKVAAKFSDTPRLRKAQPQPLQVVPLAEFLRTQPVTEVVQVTALPKQSLDKVAEVAEQVW